MHRMHSLRRAFCALCELQVFMVLVGLSMPTLFNISSLSDSAHRQLAEATHGSVPSANESALGSDHGSATASLLEPLSGGMIVVHVVACSLLMNLGKLFPAFVYSKEVGRSTRIALAVGMMPRGEVHAYIHTLATGMLSRGEVHACIHTLAVGMVLAEARYIHTHTYIHTYSLWA